MRYRAIIDFDTVATHITEIGDTAYVLRLCLENYESVGQRAFANVQICALSMLTRDEGALVQIQTPRD